MRSSSRIETRASTQISYLGETSGASQQYDHHSPATHPLASGGPTRTTLPSFLPSALSEQGGPDDQMPIGKYFREWQSMGEDFKAALSFRDYCQLKKNEKGRNYGGQGTQSSELQRTIGRMYFPTYDGTAKCTA